MTSALRREAIGEIDVVDAAVWEDLESSWCDGICPERKILRLKSMQLSAEQVSLILHGREVALKDELAEPEELAIYDVQDRLIAIGCVEDGTLSPKQVFDPGKSL
jgi:tRNA U55 pseudouridine synthase TruB